MSRHIAVLVVVLCGACPVLSAGELWVADAAADPGQFGGDTGCVFRLAEDGTIETYDPDLYNIDPARFLIAPTDKVYRILSKEKDFESQAVIFFFRAG